MTSTKHYRYLNDAGIIVGYATVDIDENILMEYVVDPNPPLDFSIERRSKDILTLKPSLNKKSSPQISRCAAKQPIIIAHISQFNNMVLPTIPSGFDGVYVVQADVPFLRSNVYNSMEERNNNAFFPNFQKDIMNFIFQTRMDIRNEIRHKVQVSWHSARISVKMERISREVINMMLESIPESALYVSSGRKSEFTS